LLKARLACAFYRSAVQAAGSWKTLEAEVGKRLPVLMYHHIGEARRGAYPDLTTSVPDFERQIRWLARHGYTSIKATDWLAWCSEGRPLPPKPVLLTFDDAYEETAENAGPILRAYGFTGSFMVVTNYIGKTNVWDELHGRPRFDIMSKDQILRQCDQGIEYGAHSRSHPELTKGSDAELCDELQGSRDALAAILGHPIRCFAYPYGDHDRRVRQCAATYFDMAFTTERKINHLSSDPHRLGRISFLPTDTAFGMWCRLQLGWSPLPRLLAYMKSRFSRLSGRRRSAEQQVAS
jgi:peptidoglycan/xylan/chitin deacetylase (PgdA/CDA1 family)